MDNIAGPENVAMIHSLFNIASTLVLMPFCKQLEKLAVIMVKDFPEKKAQDETLTMLDERFLDTPSVAVLQCKTVAHKMAQLSKDCINAAMNLFEKYDDDKFEYVDKLERKIDRYEDAIGSYIVKLSGLDVTAAESKEITMILHNIGDLERISDHAKNLAESAQELHTKKLSFSEDAQAELEVFMKAVNEIVGMSVESFEQEDVEKAALVEPLEEVIDAIRSEVKNRHVLRLQKGKCTIELGFILQDVGTNLERVADHCSNLAVCTIETQNDQFDMHHYINNIKKYDKDHFADRVSEYEKKYALPEIV